MLRTKGKEMGNCPSYFRALLCEWRRLRPGLLPSEVRNVLNIIGWCFEGTNELQGGWVRVLAMTLERLRREEKKKWRKNGAV